MVLLLEYNIFVLFPPLQPGLPQLQSSKGLRDNLERNKGITTFFFQYLYKDHRPI